MSRFVRLAAELSDRATATFCQREGVQNARTSSLLRRCHLLQFVSHYARGSYAFFGLVCERFNGGS